MNCSQCGADIPDTARFCMNCGHEVIAQPARNLSQTQAKASLGSIVSIGERVVNVLGGVEGNVTIYHQTETPSNSPSEELWRAYFRQLCDVTRHVLAQGIKASSQSIGWPDYGLIDAGQVYVSLDTTTVMPGISDPADAHQLTVLEAVAVNRRLVLLGEPGSGKSTFVSQLVNALAARHLSDQTAPILKECRWSETELTLAPIFIQLGDFARWIASRYTGESQSVAPGTELLIEFLAAWLANHDLLELLPDLRALLSRGKGIVALDGLDEVPSDVIRHIVLDSVADFATTYFESKIIVTCRTLAYKEPQWQLNIETFPILEIAPLNAQKIETLIRVWCEELTKIHLLRDGEATQQMEQLTLLIRRADFAKVVSNPLLLSVLLLVYTRGRKLPNVRSLLYEEVIDVLLLRWEEEKKLGESLAGVSDLRALMDKAGIQDVDLKRVLWQLAFETYGNKGQTAGQSINVTEPELLKRLRVLHPKRSLDWADAVIAQFRNRIGLLVEQKPGIYSFPHRTFHEYLAACYVCIHPLEFGGSDYAALALELAREPDLWREVILFSVERSVYVIGDIIRPLSFIAEICLQDPKGDRNWELVPLAGDALLAMSIQRASETSLGRSLASRCRHLLTELVTHEHLSARERAAAGKTLSAIGDERDFEELVTISGGKFEMGSESIPATAPRHIHDLRTFRIGKYLVTNQQYERFVRETGSPPPSVGSEETRPYEWCGREPSPYQRNHPVVLVTWYEAQAYCRWLTNVWRSERKINDREIVRLPTEAEWEKAARGQCGFDFPWGNGFSVSKSNNGDTGISTTCAVGLFSSGASPFGCMDMSGNVWEWTKSLWGKFWVLPDYASPYVSTDGRERGDAPEEVFRVVRGGAFDTYERGTSCFFRYRVPPCNRYYVIGFRIVVSEEPPTP